MLRMPQTSSCWVPKSNSHPWPLPSLTHTHSMFRLYLLRLSRFIPLQSTSFTPILLIFARDLIQILPIFPLMSFIINFVFLIQDPLGSHIEFQICHTILKNIILFKCSCLTMLISTVKQHDSDIKNIYLFHYDLLYDIEYSSWTIQQDLVVDPFLLYLFVFRELEEASFDYLFDIWNFSHTRLEKGNPFSTLGTCKREKHFLSVLTFPKMNF